MKMKKVMMLLAVAFAACIAQAAYVDWTINIGKAAGANKTYYVFGGSDASAVKAELSALTDSSSATLADLALATGTLNAKAGKAGGSGLDVGANTSLYMVVLDGTLDVGQSYRAATVDVTASLYTPPATTPGIYTADNSVFTAGGTISGGTPTPPGPTPGDVPEPTSGLLLLVGGAMLALRRKQK